MFDNPEEMSFKDWLNSLVKVVLWPIGVIMCVLLAVQALALMLLIVAIFVGVPIIIGLDVAGVDVCWGAVFPSC